MIVPAERSFLSFYNADHYILDKTDIPMADGVDVSYPAHIPSSRDFFYQIPKTSPKWIASANEEGYGLLQCSTRRLFGRKMFVWGMGQGGRHWNEWLSEKGSAYIEIQAGLANAYRESGFLPEWASPGHRGCMVGNNSASVVSDAILKGVTPEEDIATLYEAMLAGRRKMPQSTMKALITGRIVSEPIKRSNT